jgi:ABC-type uncharacterized transport system substrate-binding protein
MGARAAGLVTSLARPEGNVTGVAWFSLLSKEIELLKEIVPHLKRVAYITGSCTLLQRLTISPPSKPLSHGKHA